MSQPDDSRQQVLGQLARWLVGTLRPEPGWTELHLQLRPLRDEVHFRVIEVRGEERRARLGTLDQGRGPHELARRLQDLGVRPGAGTWIEAALTLTPAEGDGVTVTGRFNHDTDPQPWREGAAPFDATDLVHHLTRYPRRPEAVPAWMSERIAAAGLEVPGPASDTALTPATATAGATGPAGPTDDATGWDAAGVPDLGGDVVDAAPPPAPAPEPRDDGRPRPEVLHVVVDRDGPVLADGTRPGRRRLRLGGSLVLAEVLETVGVPLVFVDDRGTWIVRHGQSRDEGEVLGVVEQGPGASTGAAPEVRVHLVSDARPADLLDGDGRLALYYCSVPGDLQVVLDSARLGEVAPPPTPASAPDNELVRTAVAEFVAEPGPERKLHVLRQVLGGRLVVDATGSELPQPGGPSPQLRLTTLTTSDGSRALAAFTSNEALVEFRKRGTEAPVKVTGVAQSGPRLLEMFRRTEELQWFLIDPAGPSCSIGRTEVDFALAAPSAQGVKDLLSSTFTMQELLTALSEPDLSLFVAHTETEGRSGPVLLRDRGDGRPVLLTFTSAVEIAAYNTSFGARRVPVGAVLQLAIANRAKAVLINPSGPRAVLPLAQVWHALGNPELPPAPATDPPPAAP